MGLEAARIQLDLHEVEILSKIIRSKTLGSSLQDRAQIVLAASEGLTNQKIAKDHKLEEHRVSLWRTRWNEHHEQWKQLDPELRPVMSEKLVRQWLADRKGKGSHQVRTGCQEDL